jgi:hypothetical protein
MASYRIGSTFTGRRCPKGRWRHLNPEEKDCHKWMWLRIG